MKHTRQIRSKTSSIEPPKSLDLTLTTPQARETLTSQPSWDQTISSAKIIEVVWVDAQTVGSADWTPCDDVEEILNMSPPHMRSVAYLLKDTDEALYLTDTVGPNESGYLHIIPKQMVISTKELTTE